MSHQARSPDDDGLRVVRLRDGRRLYVVIAAAVALPVLVTLVAVAVIRWSARQEAPAPTRQVAASAEPVGRAPVDPPAAAPRPAAASAPPRMVPRRVVTKPVEAPAGLGASPVPRVAKPRREIDAADAIAALREEGVHDGIAAFGLPGSNPPKPGILVPEGFVLPEGFVRHYQSTDDGQQLPAILMFHPDYEFLDEQGRVVTLPDDMVVPPRLAPPGIPTDNLLEVPARQGGEPIR